MHKKSKQKSSDKKKNKQAEEQNQNNNNVQNQQDEISKYFIQNSNLNNNNQSSMLDSYRVNNQQNLLSINDLNMTNQLQPSNINSYQNQKLGTIGESSFPSLNNNNPSSNQQPQQPNQQQPQLEMQPFQNNSPLLPSASNINNNINNNNNNNNKQRQSTINLDLPPSKSNSSKTPSKQLDPFDPQQQIQIANQGMFGKPEMTSNIGGNMLYPANSQQALLNNNNMAMNMNNINMMNNTLPKTNFEFNLTHESFCCCKFLCYEYENQQCQFHADKMFGNISISRPSDTNLLCRFCWQNCCCMFCTYCYLREVSQERLNYRLKTQLSIDSKISIQMEQTSAKRCVVSYKNIPLGIIEMAKPRVHEIMCGHVLGGTPVLHVHCDKDNTDYVMHPEFTCCECISLSCCLIRAFCFKEKRTLIKQNNVPLNHQITMQKNCIDSIKCCCLPCCYPEFTKINIKIDNEMEEKKLLFLAGQIIIYEIYSHLRLKSDVFHGMK